MRLSELASAVGKGLFAGIAGTAAITASQMIEMKLSGRASSNTVSTAAGKALGVQPRNSEGRRRFTNVMHWAYGTAWGAARGLLSASGLREPAASTLHFLAVWGAAQVMLPALDAAPPATEWDAEEVAVDVLHHVVYAAATGAAYEFIDRH